MKWLENLWVGLLYAAVLGSAWVFTALDMGRALVAEVGARPGSVIALVVVVSVAIVLMSAWFSRYMGPVRASHAQLLVYDAPKGAPLQLGVVSLGGLAVSLVMGTLVVCVGAAHPPSFPVAIASAVTAACVALAWPLLALWWQRRGSELIPRWSLISADARAQAFSTTVLTLDTTAMEAAADLEKLRTTPPRADQVRALEYEKNAVDVSKLGPQARLATSPRGAERDGEGDRGVAGTASVFTLASRVARRVARSNLPLVVLAVVAAPLAALMGSAKLALAAGVLAAAILGAGLARTLAEFASLHRLRRQWALLGPGPTLAVAEGVIAVGVIAALVGVAGAGLVGTAVTSAPLDGIEWAAWGATAIAAVACGILGTATTAVKSMKAEVKFKYSPEFGPMPVHIFENLAAGRVGPAIALMAMLNGFTTAALVVVAVSLAWNVFGLREEITGADYSDTHLSRDSVLA